MYPLANWASLKRGYRFRDRTWYTRYHLGLDLIAPAGTPIYAPYDGEIIGSSRTAAQGNYVHFRPDVPYLGLNVVIRFMHLVRPGRGVGRVAKGEIIGYVGSTGMSTGAHLHVDISKGAVNIYNINNFIDPEVYNWTWVKPTPSNPTPPPNTGTFVVTVVEPANVRSQPKLSAPLSGSKTLAVGDKFDAIRVVNGDSIKGNNKWLESARHNFVWSGNCKY